MACSIHSPLAQTSRSSIFGETSFTALTSLPETRRVMIDGLTYSRLTLRRPPFQYPVYLLFTISSPLEYRCFHLGRAKTRRRIMPSSVRGRLAPMKPSTSRQARVNGEL